MLIYVIISLAFLAMLQIIPIIIPLPDLSQFVCTYIIDVVLPSTHHPTAILVILATDSC